MKVNSLVHITNKEISVNNKVIDCGEAANDFLTAIYQHLEVKYPKFHKMDKLSKLGFIGVEALKNKIDFNDFEDDEVALIFQNSHSSLCSDQIHQNNIAEDDKQVSPAVFVYTLPNIVLGEIAIRNKFFGENLFTLAPKFQISEFEKQVQTYFKLNKAKGVIGGWLNVNGSELDAKIYFIHQNESRNIYNITSV